ncbi:MAG: dihydroorotate dehydrogenase electron transfer subunit [Armatimonadota bacterium]
MKSVYECEIIAQTEVAPGVIRCMLTGKEIAQQAKPGQFLNVRVSETTDPLLRRPFSIHSTYPDEGIFSLLYVLVGRGTAILYKRQNGEKISVVGPLGSSFDYGDDPDAEHVIVAGGCGSAPLHFLCDGLCNKWGCESITVLSGAKSKDALMCETEFRSHGVDVGISTDDGSYGHKGFVTELLQKHLDSVKNPKKVRVYSCGPHQMMREVARICKEAGVAKCQVSLENNMSCGTGVCLGCVQKIKGNFVGDTSGEGWHRERVCVEGPVFDAEAIIWD